MAELKTDIPKDVVERNLALTSDIMRYLLSRPQVFDALPDQFELVILPEDDPKMRLYNLQLLDRYGSEGKPIVFARLKSCETKNIDQQQPSFFVPVAV